ncbi:MAG: phosphoribosylformylglycinamidine cyclo-ligase [Saprospiraceae bacterium]|nr:phosphoribosylformylglycinamidine cyclo-ligase [Saprospiraceae bacterium]
MENNIYDKRGVSASKYEIHNSVSSLWKGLHEKAFCKILPDYTGGSDDHVNIMHADTAGTKTSLAYIYWKETGDMTVWNDIVQDAIVMNIDDMACVGCTDNIVLSSTIGRNKHLIPGDVISVLINATQNFIEKLERSGILLHLAGGETADVGDIVRTVDVGITAFARLKKDELIVNDIKDKNIIIGFSSSGRSVYEEKFNSGIGSNGLTSARHDLFSDQYRVKYPESYSPQTDIDYVYSGSRSLTEKIQVGAEMIDIGKFLLSPTRTYIPMLKEIFKSHRKHISGLIHCTGGGQTKVMKFVNNKRIIKDNLFETPQIFQLIQAESKASIREMYEVFNMGHRMELYTEEKYAEDIINISRSMGIDAKIIGHVEECEKNELEIHTENQVIGYFY